MTSEALPLYMPDSVKHELQAARNGATKSDNAFLEQLIEGYKWQLYVLNAIQSHGYWGTVHPLRIRPDFADRADYSDAYDILVGSAPHGTSVQWMHHHDVKARTRSFETPEDFPFPTVIIEPASRFHSRGDTLPDYFTHVSRYTGKIIVVPTDDVSKWDIEYKKGRKYITAPKELCVSFDDYITNLPSKPLLQVYPEST